MKYIHKTTNKETGETIEKETKLERWVWAVIYRETPEQIQAAVDEFKKRNAGYEEEIRLRRKSMQESGIDKAAIRAMIRDFKNKMAMPVYPKCDELHQFSKDGTFHQIGEVDQDRVKMFVMYKPENPMKRIDMPIQPGMRLIHKYKNVKPFYLDEFVRVYMFGYKDGDQYSYFFILPDDRMILSNREDIDLVQFKVTKNI